MRRSRLLRRSVLPAALAAVSALTGTGTAAAADDEKELRAAHEAWVDALNRRDIDHIRRHSLAELSMFNAAGRLQHDLGEDHWARMEAAAARARGEERRVEHEIEEVRIYGDVGLVNGHSRVTVDRADGEPVVMLRRLTYVWLRTPEGWRQAHHHVSELDETRRDP